MTAAESVALAGKMWLYEDDARTFLSAETRVSIASTHWLKPRRELLRNTANARSQFRDLVDGSGRGWLVR